MLHTTPENLNHYLEAWTLSSPQLLTETVTSHVYIVTDAGTRVILKLLKPYAEEE